MPAFHCCRRKAAPQPASQAAHNAASRHRNSKPHINSSQHDSGSSSSNWDDSSEGAAGGDDSNDTDSANAFEQNPGTQAGGAGYRSQLQRNLQSQQQQQQQRSKVTRGQGRTAASSSSRRGPAGGVDEGQGQLLLLQPSFKQSKAWQYSSSNLLRLGGSSSRRRFKPVVKPEALLKPPEVTLKQLAHSVTLVHAGHYNGQVQVRSEGGWGWGER